jgi:hypothetical protein
MELGPCKCGNCQSHTMADCINGRCDCCDLEDTFSVLTGVDVELIKAG